MGLALTFLSEKMGVRLFPLPWLASALALNAFLIPLPSISTAANSWALDPSSEKPESARTAVGPVYSFGTGSKVAQPEAQIETQSRASTELSFMMMQREVGEMGVLCDA